MTEEMTIEQQNTAIAEFMGYERYEDNYGTWFKKEGLIMSMHPKLENLKYHSSWELLMPVVERIEAFGLRFEICENCADIMSKGVEDDRFPWLQEFDHIYGRPSGNKKEAVYTTTVEFIKWYNENKQP